jgi:ribosome-binding ATPase YchF (GTP1/OBG family)
LREIKNKTRKIKDKTTTSLYLTPQERAIVCKNSANTYNTFEDKVEELFKKKNIDVVSTTFNLEKEIVSQLKQAVNPKGVKPNDDFYSYINDRWIKDYELTEKQQYIIQVDDFRIIQDKVYRELIQIIEDYISNPKTKNDKKANVYHPFYRCSFFIGSIYFIVFTILSLRWSEQVRAMFFSQRHRTAGAAFLPHSVRS